MDGGFRLRSDTVRAEADCSGQQVAEPGELEWGHFGRIKAHGSFHRVIMLHAGILSSALDRIPLIGPVNRHHYDAYLKEFLRVPNATNTWLGLGTRLLAIKSPHYFICVCGPNRGQLADIFGTSRTTITLVNYWGRIIAPMQLMPWWQADMPSETSEQQI